MENSKLDGAVRHILTLVGTVLVAFGWVDQEVIDQGIIVVMQLLGSILTAVSFYKSWNAPEKKT